MLHFSLFICDYILSLFLLSLAVINNTTVFQIFHFQIKHFHFLSGKLPRGYVPLHFAEKWQMSWDMFLVSQHSESQAR